MPSTSYKHVEVKRKTKAKEKYLLIIISLDLNNKLKNVNIFVKLGHNYCFRLTFIDTRSILSLLRLARKATIKFRSTLKTSKNFKKGALSNQANLSLIFAI